MNQLQLGAFSISLTVKNIHTSKNFYEALGFSVFGGDISQNWVIMKNGNSLIGLFQGMFEKNIITFNPGWDENAKNVEPFDDVRKIQEVLKEKGIQLETETDENTSGPGYITLQDPDGNNILIDQHR
jgi:lactoylglutathione lyase